MKNQQVLCIDFGSAYTKVALRSDWNKSSNVIEGISVAAEEPAYCIPSVVARVTRKSGTRWVIGREAARLEHGNMVSVYRHWKAGLFSNSAEDNEESSYSVGVKFFRQLKTSIFGSYSKLASNCPVRVCVPCLGGHEAEVMTRLLAESGWTTAHGRAVVYEPESNVCGVFTRGRNRTWTPPKSFDKTFAFYPGMFESRGLLGTFEVAARNNRDVQYGVMVTDIGAFTTDFGFVEFDQSFYDEDVCRPEVIQQSFQIGVAELDDAIRVQFSGKVRSLLESMPTLQWESLKQRLYAGQEAMVPNPAGGTTVLGSGTQKTMVREEVERFAERVIKSLADFRRTKVRCRVNTHVITGGGSLITSVRERLLESLAKEDGCSVLNLLDQEEPFRSLNVVWNAAGEATYDQREVNSRLRLNRDLVRAGSALGGASVFFE